MLFSLGQFRVKIILGNKWCSPENSKIEVGLFTDDSKEDDITYE